ncbi:MAG TPA: TIGR03085 family metal-binding protein [Acidimicrobiales bacterium]
MTDVPLDQREREQLCDLLLELGPDAPTLCEGWTTADLAAHLVVRERDPRSMPGIVMPQRFGSYTEKLMARQKAKGYAATVQRVRAGGPLVPWRIPKLRMLLNFNEYVVHHEDVRRANGMGPRTDRPDLDGEVWSMLRRGAKLMTRNVRGAGLVLRRADARISSDEIVARTPRDGGPSATLTGAPVELLLYLFGRRGAAQVELSGPPDAVAAVEQASFGI